MIVDANTPYEILKVMDFGLAKLLGPETVNPRLSVSNNDFAVGTPGYMCPEQARGDDMDNRGDLYSVGVILYELLTGQLPFAGKSTMDMLLAHAVEPPPAFSLLGAGQVAPPAVESVVQWCLAKDPADRPSSARDVSECFEAALAACEGADGGEYAPTRPNPRPEASHLGPARQPPQAATAAPAAPDEFPEDHDPLTTVHRLAAWMPESIAAYKLRGFINDVGGEVVESVPGRIRVRLGGKGSVYEAPQRGSLSWLGIGRKINRIDMELRLQRCEEGARRSATYYRPAAAAQRLHVRRPGLATALYPDLLRPPRLSDGSIRRGGQRDDRLGSIWSMGLAGRGGGWPPCSISFSLCGRHKLKLMLQGRRLETIDQTVPNILPPRAWLRGESRRGEPSHETRAVAAARRGGAYCWLSIRCSSRGLRKSPATWATLASSITFSNTAGAGCCASRSIVIFGVRPSSIRRRTPPPIRICSSRPRPFTGAGALSAFLPPRPFRAGC